MYQHKGFGSSLFLELKKRLQSVGICTIFCWGDKESEGFWLKQGFVSIAEVDTKGRRCRPPIKADIRRALCFPGGSTLMVLHLKQQASANTLDSLELGASSKPTGNSSSDALTREDSSKLVSGAKLSNIEDNGDINHCSSKQGKVAKRKVWKSSISSLK
ncbi:putative acyl-CoA N-acyltransferase [Rosa chinensis]|uniref:Putative acyl-CoA N-acyltransferase n=1 Tax=Rosa chinensis TaxID=74649 RepID=A0A2P6REL9_ROSCH|nr:putative acyl-CoA N-acyltransferase [Rosa chinensis]